MTMYESGSPETETEADLEESYPDLGDLEGGDDIYPPPDVAVDDVALGGGRS